MAFDDLMNDIVMLVKANGERHGPYKSALTSNKCMINDSSLDAEPGEYASGDVTLNRAWIPPLYLTWD